MKFIVLFLLSLAKPGFSFQCYTNNELSGNLADEATCAADVELCYELATLKDNKCIHRRGCIKDQMNFPDQKSIDHIVEATKNALFRVCASDRCNKNTFDCKLQDEGNTTTAGTSYYGAMIALLCVSILLAVALLVVCVGGGVKYKKLTSTSTGGNYSSELS